MESWKECADFNVSRWPSIDKTKLQDIRHAMLIPYSIVVHLTYADDSWYDYFIYESQWGFFLTYASMLCASYAMHEDEAKNT